DDDGAALLAFAAEQGGHAGCLRPAADRTAPGFPPPAPALAALMRRVRERFDPAGIFNPERYFSWM
ncbi:MAG: FAD-linked oxidase C-terminal domain-containing protein, partial [Gammaproteobacteria bacterium]